MVSTRMGELRMEVRVEALESDMGVVKGDIKHLKEWVMDIKDMVSRIESWVAVHKDLIEAHLHTTELTRQGTAAIT